MWLMLASPLQAEMWLFLGLHRSCAFCYNHCEVPPPPAMFPCHLTLMPLTFFLLPFPWRSRALEAGSMIQMSYLGRRTLKSLTLCTLGESFRRGVNIIKTHCTHPLTAVLFIIEKFETTKMFINWWMDNENSTFKQWNILQLLRKMKL